MLVIGVLREVQQLSYTSYGFVMIIRVVVLEASKESMQLTCLLCFLMACVGNNRFHPI